MKSVRAASLSICVVCYAEDLIRRCRCVAHQENIRAFSRFFFNPRVLRPISQCDSSTTILGFRSSIPIFVSGAALAKLGHPEGEANITRGCGRAGIIQMVSSHASLSFSQIADACVHPSQPLFFQLYKLVGFGERALERIREAERLGYNAIFLTVDVPVAGHRELDIHAPFVLSEQEREAERLAGKEGEASPEVPQQEEGDDQEGEQEPDDDGTAGMLLSGTDKDMSWKEVSNGTLLFLLEGRCGRLLIFGRKTIPWLKSVTKLPVVIKGVQCVEDAVLAAEYGVDGILISNHGGSRARYPYLRFSEADLFIVRSST